MANVAFLGALRTFLNGKLKVLTMKDNFVISVTGNCITSIS
jgi:hypothetical protein